MPDSKNSTPQEQICTMTLLRFKGTQMLWIFGQMQKSLPVFAKVPGLKFFKLMGSGGKNGFSRILNPSIYVLHGVWDSEADAQKYFQDSEHFGEYKSRTTELYTIFMRTTKAHGSWSGSNPYNQNFPPQDGKIAVITRAKIKLRYVPKFWKYVPKVSQKLEDQDGSIFSIGIGEYPWFMQATFSIWQDMDSMRAYAYQSKLHTEVIRKTRELGWYSEDLFANFSPYQSEGTWEGQDLLK